MESITNTYTIREFLLGRLQDSFAKLAKVATKLNVPVPTIEILEEIDRSFRDDHDFETIIRFVKILVTGCVPMIAGWKFAGTIQHLTIEDKPENIIRTLPEIQLPTDFRNHTAYCDHCKTNRYRKDTYVLQNTETGEFKQVGSSCLVDFTGHGDPQLLASALEMYLRCFDLADNAESDCEGMGGREESKFRIEQVLYWTAGVIHSQGWLSRGKVRETGTGIATADQVGDLLSPDRTQKDKDFRTICTPSEFNANRAEEALMWARSLTESDVTNDYLQNVRVVAHQDYLESRMIGIACSILPAYDNDLRRRAERAAQPESHFVGKEKERLSFTATYQRSLSFDGQFGATFFHFFVDESGNVLKWSTGKDLEIERGAKMQIKGTVKKHETYKGIAQTVITRCDVQEVRA